MSDLLAESPPTLWGIGSYVLFLSVCSYVQMQSNTRAQISSRYGPDSTKRRIPKIFYTDQSSAMLTQTRMCISSFTFLNWFVGPRHSASCLPRLKDVSAPDAASVMDKPGLEGENPYSHKSITCANASFVAGSLLVCCVKHELCQRKESPIFTLMLVYASTSKHISSICMQMPRFKDKPFFPNNIDTAKLKTAIMVSLNASANTSCLPILICMSRHANVSFNAPMCN